MTPLALDQVLRKINNLPSLPTVIMELLASMDREDVNIDALARGIAQDQALTAKTLRVANSSFYGMAHQITTISEAIAILGFRAVRGLATTAALVSTFDNHALGRINFVPFWRHSLATAVCARELARHLKLNPEHAYTAGLLHDIGRLVLATQFQPSYQEVVAHRAKHDCTLMEAERAVLSIDHAAVGHAMTAHWKFPPSIQLAIAHHHSPEPAMEQTLPCVIQAADALAHALDFSGDDDDLVPHVPLTTWQQLGLDDATLLEVMASSEHQFDGASLVLSH
jgi:putative nucleotidyltransferase with HDIG domain